MIWRRLWRLLVWRKLADLAKIKALETELGLVSPDEQLERLYRTGCLTMHQMAEVKETKVVPLKPWSLSQRPYQWQGQDGYTYAVVSKELADDREEGWYRA